MLALLKMQRFRYYLIISLFSNLPAGNGKRAYDIAF
jgi:hypothetical protein